MQMNIFVKFALAVYIRVNWCQFASDFFDKKDANHHESRIVRPYPNELRISNCLEPRNAQFSASFISKGISLSTKKYRIACVKYKNAGSM